MNYPITVFVPLCAMINTEAFYHESILINKVLSKINRPYYSLAGIDKRTEDDEAVFHFEVGIQGDFVGGPPPQIVETWQRDLRLVVNSCMHSFINSTGGTETRMRFACNLWGDYMPWTQRSRYGENPDWLEW